jgi:hypothetical protein
MDDPARELQRLKVRMGEKPSLDHEDAQDSITDEVKTSSGAGWGEKVHGVRTKLEKKPLPEDTEPEGVFQNVIGDFHLWVESEKKEMEHPYLYHLERATFQIDGVYYITRPIAPGDHWGREYSEVESEKGSRLYQFFLKIQDDMVLVQPYTQYGDYISVGSPVKLVVPIHASNQKQSEYYLETLPKTLNGGEHTIRVGIPPITFFTSTPAVSPDKENGGTLCAWSQPVTFEVPSEKSSRESSSINIEMNLKPIEIPSFAAAANNYLTEFTVMTKGRILDLNSLWGSYVQIDGKLYVLESWWWKPAQPLSWGLGFNASPSSIINDQSTVALFSGKEYLMAWVYRESTKLDRLYKLIPIDPESGRILSGSDNSLSPGSHQVRLAAPVGPPAGEALYESSPPFDSAKLVFGNSLSVKIAEEESSSTGNQPGFNVSGSVFDETTWLVSDEKWDRFLLIDNEKDFESGFMSLLHPENIPVLLYGENMIVSTETDSEGGFVFDDVPAGDYTLQVQLLPDTNVYNQFDSEHGKFRIPEKKLSVPYNYPVELKFEWPKLSLSGRVVDPDGNPIPHATITGWPYPVPQTGEPKIQEKITVTSDEKGEFRMEGIDPVENLYLLTRYVNDGGLLRVKPDYDVVFDLYVKADGYAQLKENLPRVPLVSEDQLIPARKVWKVLSRLGGQSETERVRKNWAVMADVPPHATTDNKITGIEIVLTPRP